MNEEHIRHLSLDEVLKQLNTEKNGLTTQEAQKRLQEYGENAISEKEVNPLLKFLGYFLGFIPWMIEIAVILSALVREWPDFFIWLILFRRKSFSLHRTGQV